MTQPIELLCRLVEERAPKAVVQVGLGDPDHTGQLCQALSTAPAATLTLIDPTLFSDPAHAKWVKTLQRSDAGSAVEFMASRADQVLPDLYFQELSFDLAILNPCQDYEETLVAYYYLDKLLAYQGSVLALNQADTDLMRKLGRHIQQQQHYRIAFTAGPNSQPPRLEKLVRDQLSRVPGFIRQRLSDVIQPEWLVSDSELGLQGTLVVLERISTHADAVQDVDELIDAL